MNNSLEKLLLFSLLLMLVIAPFAGIAPLMVVLLGMGVCWLIGSWIQEIVASETEREDEKA